VAELAVQAAWRNVEHVELATLADVEWFNSRRACLPESPWEAMNAATLNASPP